MSRDKQKRSIAGGKRQRAFKQSAQAQRSRGVTGSRLNLSSLPLFDSSPAGRRLRVLLLIAVSFFMLWLSIKVFSQVSLWPLLVAPIMLSAWYFYEVGALTTVFISALLLVQVSIDKPGYMLLAVASFAMLGLGLGWGQRRQRVVHRQTLRSSLTDSLTGLFNYGYIVEALDRELHRVDRYGGMVTLIMIDVDHFKSFNDRYGHQAGNEALKALGAVLKREKRTSDIVARFGGEEFVMLIPNDEESGLETAERIRQEIARIQVPVGKNQAASMTVSVGVANYPHSASSKEELLSRADELLYASKRNGRDQVSVAPERQRLAVL